MRRTVLLLSLLTSITGCIEAGGGKVIERRDDDDKGPADAGMDEDAAPPRDAAIPRDTNEPRDAVIPMYDRTCEQIKVEAAQTTPNVLIVLDRSGSMYDDDYGPLVDRWNPAVSAVDQVTHALSDRVRFGLMLFGSNEECAPGSVRVAPELGTADAIMSQLQGDPETVTGGGTPTAASLGIARSALTSSSERSYVLLVTDGAPNCNSSLDANTCRCVVPVGCQDNVNNCLDDNNAVEAVRQLNEGGVSTFVIGYGTADWTDVLDRMAQAGNTGMDSHIRVDDGAALEGALRNISRSVISCTYTLEHEIEDRRFVRVQVDGESVHHVMDGDDGNGWALPNRTTIELVGETCALIQDGEHHAVDITIECEPPLI